MDLDQKKNFTTERTGYGLNDERSIVEGGDKFLESAERLRDVDVHLHDQVDPVPLEQRVLLLIQHDDDIAGFETGFLKIILLLIRFPNSNISLFNL